MFNESLCSTHSEVRSVSLCETHSIYDFESLHVQNSLVLPRKEESRGVRIRIVLIERELRIGGPYQ